jgi:hypothetical protein
MNRHILFCTLSITMILSYSKHKLDQLTGKKYYKTQMYSLLEQDSRKYTQISNKELYVQQLIYSYQIPENYYHIKYHSYFLKGS